MNDLFNIEPTAPRWQELADRHGIETICIDAAYGTTWRAEIEWFGHTEAEQGETKREAVIALIHQLQLEGWRSVSI